VLGVGGLEAAHAVTGYPTSRLAEAYAPGSVRMPRVDHAVALEMIGQQPQVTAVMARLAGCMLVPMPEARGESGAAIASVLRQAGEIGACAAEAMADGRLGAAERAALVDACGALARAAAAAQAVLAKGDAR
jgi:hypothetical protein